MEKKQMLKEQALESINAILDHKIRKLLLQKFTRLVEELEGDMVLEHHYLVLLGSCQGIVTLGFYQDSISSDLFDELGENIREYAFA